MKPACITVNGPKSSTCALAPHRHTRGAALLLTLVILSAIVVLFVILSRLVTVERRVSQGYSEILRAEMAAQAGTAEASSLLLELFSKRPDSVTFWDPNLGATTTPGTVFMYRDLPPDQEYMGSTTAGVAPKVFAIPLISGAVTKEFYPASEYALTLPASTTANPASATDPKPYIDINAPDRFSSSGSTGWIGKLPCMTDSNGNTQLEIRVPWVEVLQDPSKAKDTSRDPVSRRPKNPAVMRYAWWVEDESFKLNVNTAKAAPRGDVLAETTDDKVKPMPSFRGIFTPDVALSVAQTRDNLAGTGGKMLSVLQIGHTGTLPSDPKAFARQYQSLLTTKSSGLLLSRTGAKRVNINSLVEASLKDLPEINYFAEGGTGIKGPDLSEASAKVTRAIAQISVSIKKNAPNFAQRFYRIHPTQASPTNYQVNPLRNELKVTSSGLEPHTGTYIRKIAANLFDYISPGRTPTVIDNGGNVLLGHRYYAGDLFNMSAEIQQNPVHALGKKNVPYFTEYILHAKQIGYETPSKRNREGGLADFTLEIDHYFEFWNMSTEDITPSRGDLGPNPYLVLENQPAITTINDPKKSDSEDIPLGRAFEIKLAEKFIDAVGNEADLVFPAGKLTIITTDPNFADNGDYLDGVADKKLSFGDAKIFVAKKLYIPGTSQRCDSGTSMPPYSIEKWTEGTDVEPSTFSSTLPNVRRYLCTAVYADTGFPEIQMGPDGEGQLRQKVILGNQFGVLDAPPSIAMDGPKTNLIAFKYKGNRPIPALNHFRGSYLSVPTSGDHPGEGDPRSSLEALTLDIKNDTYSALKFNGMEKLDPDDMQPSMVMQKSNLGSWPSEMKNPMGYFKFWDTDLAEAKPGAVYAPAVIANAPMKSIGELGNIFDPIRYDQFANALLMRRAGGHTLTVGQPDVLWDGTRSATAPEAEMKFQVSRSRGWTAWRLADIFTVKDDADLPDEARTEVAGLYNPNGILRDRGLILKTMLEGLQFEPGKDSDRLLQGAVLNTSEMENNLVKNLTDSLPQDVKDGGPAFARYLAQRLSRQFPTRFSPLWEPGELSQLDLFSPTNTKEQIKKGASTKNLNDRGREALFRRLVDLTTTKGNTFTVYVVGQALDQYGKPIATKGQRVTIRLRPKFSPALVENFDPADSAAVNERFRRPDAYELEIIGTEDA